MQNYFKLLQYPAECLAQKALLAWSKIFLLRTEIENVHIVFTGFEMTRHKNQKPLQNPAKP